MSRIFDIEQLVSRQSSLFLRLVPPTILFILGIGLIIYSEGDVVSPTQYLLSFFAGSIVSLVAIILAVVTILKHARKTLEQGHPFERTAERLKKDKAFRAFYWAVGILAVADLALSIALGSDAYFGILSGLLIIAVGFAELYGRKE